LETLSSQVLEFESKPRANPIGAPFRASFLGKLLVLPANIRLDWEVIASYKHSSLFGLVVSDKVKKFYNVGPRSYLGGRSLSGPDGMASLRDTTINSHSLEQEDRHRYLASRRFVVDYGL
jgi:hypothetical protein